MCEERVRDFPSYNRTVRVLYQMSRAAVDFISYVLIL